MGVHVEEVGDEETCWSGSGRRRVVPPRSTTDLPIPLAPVNLDVAQSIVVLSFRDSAGGLWTRGADGQLMSRGEVMTAPTK